MLKLLFIIMLSNVRRTEISPGFCCNHSWSGDSDKPEVPELSTASALKYDGSCLYFHYNLLFY